MDFGFYKMDCVEGMKQFKDNYFDLAIVDPPYANPSKEDYERFHRSSGGRFDRYLKHTSADWDKQPPNDEYFNELFRVSKHQIIWGGNYFDLPPTRCFIVWHKTNIPLDFTMCNVEYAWTNFDMSAKLYQQSSQNQEGRFHPTQKPVELYEYLLNKFGERDFKILDTHCGSASSPVACERNGYKNYVGFEIDDYYYQKASERLEAEKSQQNIFDYF